MNLRVYIQFVLIIASLGLAGCQSTPDPAAEMFRAVWQGGNNPTGQGLDPRYRYLRVTQGRNVAFFALGFIDAHPQGDIEVWYSGSYETLRLLNGRVVGLSGTPTEWRQVQLSGFPQWTDLQAADAAGSGIRVRDVMPGYRFNIRDDLRLQAIPVPAQSALVALDARRLRWFEERMISTSAGAEHLPPARYAVEGLPGAATVVYGEQCLSRDFCLTWQRWQIQP